MLTPCTNSLTDSTYYRDLSIRRLLIFHLLIFFHFSLNVFDVRRGLELYFMYNQMLHPSLNSVPEILTKAFLIISASDPLMTSK